MNLIDKNGRPIYIPIGGQYNANAFKTNADQVNNALNAAADAEGECCSNQNIQPTGHPYLVADNS